jgi:hypothetical protein
MDAAKMSPISYVRGQGRTLLSLADLPREHGAALMHRVNEIGVRLHQAAILGPSSRVPASGRRGKHVTPRAPHTPQPATRASGAVVARAAARYFFRRTSSSGADHGYGSIFMRAASSTRGPTPLGQM